MWYKIHIQFVFLLWLDNFCPVEHAKVPAEESEDSRVLRMRCLCCRPSIASKLEPGSSPLERPGLDNISLNHGLTLTLSVFLGWQIPNLITGLRPTQTKSNKMSHQKKPNMPFCLCHLLSVREIIEYTSITYQYRDSY